MNNGILSQQEIDALLAGGNKKSGQNTAELITEFERDTLGEIGNISMGTSATILSTLLHRKVAITTPEVKVISREQLRSDFPMPYVIVEVQYREGLHGANVFVVKTEDAGMIADLMMGMEPRAGRSSLSEIELSAVGEAMNQMMGSATTSLSTMFNTRIDISPPLLTVVNLGEEKLGLHSMFEELVTIKFQMKIENLLESEIMQITPIEAVKHMMEMLTGDSCPSESQQTDSSLPEPETDDHFEQLEAALARDSLGTDRPAGPETAFAAEPPPPKPTPASLTVQPVQFASLHEFPLGSMPQNIGLIMDVPLDVSVELGKARKTIKEVLELQQGSIIQLDKMAGEPVDLLVNGKLIARGEVVVIDENYGIRITAIISPIDRVNKLQ
ncbi:MAG TPA: flagellar motor switch phosphatase FliY [Syntrophomonas sp.]|nr:flagellar motor switch phosphatase FliY [Syntrophomonas sp.]